MGELVALDLPAGPGFVDALRAAWDAGDAVLPLDPRLPRPAADRLLDALRPARVVVRRRSRRRAGRAARPSRATPWSSPPAAPPASPRAWSTPTPRSTASAVATSAGLDVDPGRDRWVACLPLAHIGGLSVVTRSLVTGTPLHRPRAVRPAGGGGRGTSGRHPGVAGRHRARPAPTRRGYRAVLLGGSAPRRPAGQRRHHLRHDRDGLRLRLRRRPARRGRAPHRRRRPGGERRGPGPGPDAAPRPTGTGPTPASAAGWLPTGDAGPARGRRHPRRLRPHGRGHRHRRREGVAGAGRGGPRRPSRRGRGGGVEAARPRVGRAGGGLGGPGAGAAAPALDELPRAGGRRRSAPWAAPRELVVVDALPRTAGRQGPAGRRWPDRCPDPLAGRSGLRTASRWPCTASRRRPPGSRR